MIDFTYLHQPPRKFTFEQPQLKQWVERWCQGRVLNLFAGKTRLNVEEIRVDINPDMVADHYEDAYEFVLKCTDKFDTVLLDPPYNWRKAKEKYLGKYIGNYPLLKDIIPYILSSRGRVISLGYDSVGMSKSREFEKIAICLVCHSGDFHDTICLVERSLK